MASIHVLDSWVGSGRTTAMINYVNSASVDKHFIYVASTEKETGRFRRECSRKFYTLKDEPYKYALGDFKKLLGKGRNIVTTRALYDIFNAKNFDLCTNYDYELILDDVNYLSDRSPLTNDDMGIMLERYMDIQDNGFAKWRPEAEKYFGLFNDIKNLVHMNALAVLNGYPLLWRYPIGVFEAFTTVFIVTHKFNTKLQKRYLDNFKIEYDYYHIDYEGNMVKGYEDFLEDGEGEYDVETAQRLEWDNIY